MKSSTAASELAPPHGVCGRHQLLMQLRELLGLRQDRVESSLEELAFGDGRPAGTVDDGDQLLVKAVAGNRGECGLYCADLTFETLDMFLRCLGLVEASCGHGCPHFCNAIRVQRIVR